MDLRFVGGRMGDTSRGVLAWITLHCSVLSPESQDDATKKVKVGGEELYLQAKKNSLSPSPIVRLNK